MDREPFSESEKRFIVSQILKASSLPLERLVQLIIESKEVPQWENIFLPTGRTLQECKAAFEALCQPECSPRAITNNASIPSPSTPVNSPLHKRKSGPGAIQLTSASNTESKRRSSGIRNKEPGGQYLILPKPTSDESSPSTTNYTVATPAAKRRGRPPKAEIERRHQEAIARGEVIVPKIMERMQATESKSAMSGYTPIAPAPASMDLKNTSEARFLVQNTAENSSGTLRNFASRSSISSNQSSVKRPGEGQFQITREPHNMPSASPHRAFESTSSRTTINDLLRSESPDPEPKRA